MTNTESPIFLSFEPAEVYHARSREFLTSHQLSDFRANPKLYRKKQLGLVGERESAAYLFGRAAHVLILEGRERYEAEFAVGGPINPKTGNPYGSNTKAFAEWAEQAGKPVLSDDQAAVVEQMHAAVREHAMAAELLADGVPEGVVRAEYCGHRCQVRLDWLNPNPGCGLVDLKTCDNLDTFEADFCAYGYGHQLAFYRAVVVQATGIVFPVHAVAVEKREPFRCGVWAVDPGVLDRAEAENEAAMRELTQCRERDNWFTRYESRRVITQL